MNKFLKSKGPRWIAITGNLVVLAMFASIVLGWFGQIGDWFLLLGQLIFIGFGYGLYLSIYSMVLTFRQIAVDRRAGVAIAPKHLIAIVLAAITPVLVVGFYVFLVNLQG